MSPHQVYQMLPTIQISMSGPLTVLIFIIMLCIINQLPFSHGFDR